MKFKHLDPNSWKEKQKYKEDKLLASMIEEQLNQSFKQVCRDADWHQEIIEKYRDSYEIMTNPITGSQFSFLFDPRDETFKVIFCNDK